MKKTSERLQDWMSAITFAEAGEWETAIKMTPAPLLDARISPLEQTFMAAAFAEAGEWATAIELAPPQQIDRRISEMEKTFMAVAFAEAGLHVEAERLMHKNSKTSRSIPSFTRRVGLGGVRATCGILVAK